MKTNALVAFFLFFSMALFALTRALFVFVRDSDDHAIANGGKYYLFQQGYARATIASAEIYNPPGCPRSHSLAVELLSDNYGNSTKFVSSSRESHIATKLKLEISFDPLQENKCTQDPEWLVAKDKDWGYDAVMVGHPDEYLHPLPGWFSLEHFDFSQHHYRLAFCYDQLHGHECKYVGVKTDVNEHKRLIVADNATVAEPLVFMLVASDHIDLNGGLNLHNN